MIFRFIVTLLALTRLSNFVTRFIGAKRLLPALSTKRFCAVGGLEEAHVDAQLDACRSFSDPVWTAYWSNIARSYIQKADRALKLSGLASLEAWACDDSSTSNVPENLRVTLGASAKLFTEVRPGKFINPETFSEGATEVGKTEFAVADAVLKATTYYFIAAWPGNSPQRKKCYDRSWQIFEPILEAASSHLGFIVDSSIVKSDCGTICVVSLIPQSHTSAQLGAVLFTNGLEGTNVETLSSFLRSGTSAETTAYFFMEMPGTYAYSQPMHIDKTQKAYEDVISHIEHHPAVNPKKISMVGISFGAYWSARMSLLDKRLVAAVANGAPLSTSFSLAASIGVPQIILDCMSDVFGAKSQLDLKRKLDALRLTSADLAGITCPILAINGDSDTLVSTQDTIMLGTSAVNGLIKLYARDDHCAMAHIDEWMRLADQWLLAILHSSEASSS